MNTLQRCKPLLGTYVEISISGDVSDNELISVSENAFAEICRIQNIMSFHDEHSELSQINSHLLHAKETPLRLSGDLLKVLQFSLNLYQASEQFFDISIAPHLVRQSLLPLHLPLSAFALGNTSHLVLKDNLLWSTKPVCIDLGGVAKGYAVDCAVKQIPRELTYTINAGGDLFESHFKDKTVSLKYGKKNKHLKTIAMKNNALATSGNYYLGNNSDIIHPKKNKAHHFKGCVSVFGDNVMLADALTKVVILAPTGLTKSLLNMFDAQAIIVNRWGFTRTL